VLQLWKLWTTEPICTATHDILVMQIAADCLVNSYSCLMFFKQIVSNHSVVNYLHMWKVQRHHSILCTGRIKKMTKQYQLVQPLQLLILISTAITEHVNYVLCASCKYTHNLYALPVNTHTILFF
jgi:protoheme ferro-lyase